MRLGLYSTEATAAFFDTTPTVHDVMDTADAIEARLPSVVDDLQGIEGDIGAMHGALADLEVATVNGYG